MKFAIIGKSRSEYGAALLGKLSQGALRPEYVLIEDNDPATLAAAGPFTRSGTLPNSILDSQVADDFRAACETARIPWLAVPDQMGRQVLAVLRANPVDLLLVTDSPILRGPILYTPRLGILNIHAAALPCYRGAGAEAFVRTLKEPAYLSAHLINPWLNEGDILHTERSSQGTSIEARMELALRVLDQIRNGKAIAKPQDFWDGSTYARDSIPIGCRVDLAKLSKAAEQKLWGTAPYAVIVSFDLAGESPERIAEIQALTERFQIYRPTVFVNERVPSALQSDDFEIGLLTTYNGYDWSGSIATQKQTLEQSLGKKVVSHRGHYTHFDHPRTWSHVLRTGFDFDLTLKESSAQGDPHQGYFVVDPDGRDEFLTISILTELHDRTSADVLCDRLKTHGGIASISGTSPHLEYLLERAKSDGAKLGGVADILSASRAFWLQSPDRPHWPECAAAAVAAPPALEVNSYEAAFGATNYGACSIDNAVESFLASLPNDAVSIVDVGCGPGNMTRRVPIHHRVLCIDLNDTILERVRKPRRLGNVCDIPLPDQSADLVFTSDVFEHLTDEELVTAVREVTRVSRRYVYLQTPLAESLHTGLAHCSSCGHTWHVNSHKQSFTLSRMLKLLPEPWRPIAVTFTGDVLHDRTPPIAEIVMAAQSGRPPATGKAACPSCGKTSSSAIITSWRDVSHLTSAFLSDDPDSPFPYYSEIGVWFELNGQPVADSPPQRRTRSGQMRPWPAARNESSATINFAGTYVETSIWNPFTRVPQVIPGDVATRRHAGSTEFLCAGEVGYVLLAFGVPSTPGARLKIKGTVNNPAELRFVIPQTNELIRSFSTQADFEIDLGLDCLVGTGNLAIGLVWTGAKSLHLISAMIDGTSSTNLAWFDIPAQSFQHVELARHGLKFRAILPDNGSWIVQDSLEHWVEAMMSATEVTDRLSRQIAELNSGLTQYYLTRTANVDVTTLPSTAPQDGDRAKLALLSERYRDACFLIGHLQVDRSRPKQHWMRKLRDGVKKGVKKVGRAAAKVPLLKRTARMLRVDRVYRRFIGR